MFNRKAITDSHPMGACDLRLLLAQSSNIGAARLAHRVGTEAFVQGIRRFGFGAPSGVGLPADSAGILHRAPTDLGLASLGFGQGVAVTPLQLAMAVAALGNDGVRMKPRLVARVVDAHGVPEQVVKPEVAGVVVSPEHARAVVGMMVGVTEDSGGTGYTARVPGITVAGKTGTAQKAREDGRGYGADRISSFVALVPAEAPRLAVVVSVDSPSGPSKSGTAVAAPAVAQIIEGARGWIEEPEHEVTVAQAVTQLAPDQSLAAEAQLARTDGGWQMPDLTGQVLRDATRLLALADLRLSVEGHGRVVAQQPAPGSILPSGSRIALTLR